MSDTITAAGLRILERGHANLLSSVNSEIDRHIACFYRDAAFLADTISNVAGRTLTKDGAAVLIATTSHLRLIEERLILRGFDLEHLRTIGRYVALDAKDTLARLTFGGWPDEDRFRVVIGNVIRQAIHNSGNRYVIAFGEMVALLCADDRTDAAVHLEQLWNSLLAQYHFSLYCAYSLHDFISESELNAVFQICAEHSLTIPAETRL
ncbi:MAG: MEDS domain-containing protein [Deltaproteobacteria bacterium]|nr:MEDS domain-containing protein [Deltaproteobacteria bacterium]